MIFTSHTLTHSLLFLLKSLLSRLSLSSASSFFFHKLLHGFQLIFAIVYSIQMFASLFLLLLLLIFPSHFSFSIFLIDGNNNNNCSFFPVFLQKKKQKLSNVSHVSKLYILFFFFFLFCFFQSYTKYFFLFQFGKVKTIYYIV